MSAAFRLSNSTSRPVQLHLADGVTVIPAFGVVSCSEETLAEAQVRTLRRKGVLIALAPTSEATVPAQDARESRRGRSSRRSKRVQSETQP